MGTQQNGRACRQAKCCLPIAIAWVLILLNSKQLPSILCNYQFMIWKRLYSSWHYVHPRLTCDSFQVTYKHDCQSLLLAQFIYFSVGMVRCFVVVVAAYHRVLSHPHLFLVLLTCSAHFSHKRWSFGKPKRLTPSLWIRLQPAAAHLHTICTSAHHRFQLN